MQATDILDKIVERAVQCRADPLRWVRYAYDWGHGDLAQHPGPRVWQAEILNVIGAHLQDKATRHMPLRIAVASGHGIGKSAAISMVVNWAMSTCRDTRVVVTANTETQLRTKTWPEVAKWSRLSLTADWWSVPALSLYSNDPACTTSWRADAVSWSVSNTEAFAGLHNEGKRIVLVYDEAAGIDDKVWEVSDGALTDENTEIIWIAFGNPTRNTGRFAECFGRMRHLWVTRQIDSRTVEGTNKAYLQELVDTYGEDSDIARRRVRGIFPRAGDKQFIPRDLVDTAMDRKFEAERFVGRTAAVGVDVARFGSAQSVIRTRVGRDGRSIPPKRYRGLDTVQLAGRVAEHIEYLKTLGLKAVVFVDGGGVGGGVVDNLRRLRHDPIEVNFGGKPDDPRKYANKRAEMWGKCKDWLVTGSLERDEALATDLTSVEYGFNNQDQVQLERKEDMEKRGLASPDDADALALTFAHPVPEHDPQLHTPSASASRQREYDPYKDL